MEHRWVIFWVCLVFVNFIGLLVTMSLGELCSSSFLAGMVIYSAIGLRYELNLLMRKKDDDK